MVQRNLATQIRRFRKVLQKNVNRAKAAHEATHGPRDDRRLKTPTAIFNPDRTVASPEEKKQLISDHFTRLLTDEDNTPEIQLSRMADLWAEILRGPLGAKVERLGQISTLSHVFTQPSCRVGSTA